jgi:hypothetical protein
LFPFLEATCFYIGLHLGTVCTLAGSVPADDAHDVALFHFEIDVLESPDGIAC